MDQELLLFRRQYFQLLEPTFLAWPPTSLLKDVNTQTWLYQKLFNPELNERPPSERYQLRVLRLLLTKIEQSFEDSDEDVGLYQCSFDIISLSILREFFCFFWTFSNPSHHGRKSQMISWLVSLLSSRQNFLPKSQQHSRKISSPFHVYHPSFNPFSLLTILLLPCWSARI